MEKFEKKCGLLTNFLVRHRVIKGVLTLQIAMSNSLAGFGYDIGIEAEDGDHEGALPSLVTIAWENTDDVKNLASFFTLTKGAVAISEAQCITHKVK